MYCSCSCIFFTSYHTKPRHARRLLYRMSLHYVNVHSTLSCGPKRDRTDDLLNANQALSQLSYGPIPSLGRLIALWWARVDLNHRPHAYQACALTS